jgi:hypothetical protein
MFFPLAEVYQRMPASYSKLENTPRVAAEIYLRTLLCELNGIRHMQHRVARQYRRFNWSQ